MKLLVFETVFLLLFARIMIIGTPYRIWKRLLGTRVRQASFAGEDIDLRAVRRISFWINRIAPHLPLHCSCLAQAIAGKIMLERRGISPTVYLGVKNNAKIEAHAWLMVNDIPVTGGRNNDTFATVGKFE